VSLFQSLKLRLSPPKLTDPEFGPLRFMYIANAPERSYWEAESWLFGPTQTLVGVGLLGSETGPLPEARAFYLGLPGRFAGILDSVKPLLDRVTREWLDRPLAADCWSDVKLSGFDVDDPRIQPLNWSISFETIGDKWLGIMIPFVGEQPGEPVVDT
jgi:hypothetical protein